jgi:hypothetical protein
LSAGIPSHDRFNAVLAAIKPAEFEKCLLSWITALHEITGGQIVALDGKMLRRSFDAASSKSANRPGAKRTRADTAEREIASWNRRSTTRRPACSEPT